ncbi:hypothetical protein ACIP79_19690 [Streptomyces sp. NPDC088747]|uniref:hypothetical protein n=1 Tax=Streptomyces sp. NPDC088747 TaxID=3365886 RepID=UPI003802ACA5
MRVFVAGGTGVVGRRLVPRPPARGHRVTATATRTDGPRLPERPGADGAVTDGLDPVAAGERPPHPAACAGAGRPPRLSAGAAGQAAVTPMTRGRGFSRAKAGREPGRELRHPSWRQGFKEKLA